MRHLNVSHNETYVDGIIQTNAIEGFSSLAKRAMAGQHIHYTVEHPLAYIYEAKCKRTTYLEWTRGR